MKRLAYIFVLVTAVLLLMGADNSDTARLNTVGGKIMCSCGCAQMLLKCNHIGCPNSDQMIRDLKANLQTHAKDEDVLQWFRENWGVTAVVEPASHGFELLAWVMPPAALALGCATIAWLLVAVSIWIIRQRCRFV